MRKGRELQLVRNQHEKQAHKSRDQLLARRTESQKPCRSSIKMRRWGKVYATRGEGPSIDSRLLAHRPVQRLSKVWYSEKVPKPPSDGTPRRAMWVNTPILQLECVRWRGEGGSCGGFSWFMVVVVLLSIFQFPEPHIASQSRPVFGTNPSPLTNTQ